MADLKVFYGTRNRWNQDELDRATAIIGHECHATDSLQADFEVDDKDARSLVMLLENAGIPAEAILVDGNRIGRGCPSAAIEREHRQMRANYHRLPMSCRGNPIRSEPIN